MENDRLRVFDIFRAILTSIPLNYEKKLSFFHKLRYYYVVMTTDHSEVST